MEESIFEHNHSKNSHTNFVDRTLNDYQMSNTAFEDELTFTITNLRDTISNYAPNTALVSSKFPNGILTTDEGYQFELRIYPQVCIFT